MECIPFVRRISNLRKQSMVKHGSPGDFNKKAFPAEQKRNSNRFNSSKRLSAAGSRGSYESDNTTENTSSDSATSCSSDYDRQSGPDSRESMTQGYHPQRNVISPSVCYSDQMSGRCDDASTLFSLSNEMDITITLNRDDFLGISIVGQNFSNGDCNLFVGAVIPGGAVNRDGRIQPGDIILAVNGVSLEGKSNKQAVNLLRQAVQASRNITLSVVGSWDDESVYSEGTCIQPIDPLLWLTHNSVMDKQQDGGDPHAPHNRNIGRLKSQPSIGSSSMSSSMPSTTARIRSRFHQQALPLETPTDIVANRLRLHVVTRNNTRNNSKQYGLNSENNAAQSLQERNTINGVELQMWLYKNIRGFKDLAEVEIYATHLLAHNYLIPYSSLSSAAGTDNLTFNRRENYIVSTKPVNQASRSTTPSIHSRSVHSSMGRTTPSLTADSYYPDVHSRHSPMNHKSNDQLGGYSAQPIHNNNVQQSHSKSSPSSKVQPTNKKSGRSTTPLSACEELPIDKLQLMHNQMASPGFRVRRY